MIYVLGVADGKEASESMPVSGQQVSMTRIGDCSTRDPFESWLAELA